MTTERLGPGVYRIGDQIEIDIPELLRHFGWPDTPEHRDEATAAAEAALRQAFPHVPLEVRVGPGT